MPDENMAICAETTVFLANVCKELKPAISVDLGTGTSLSVCVMAENVPNGAVIWTVDDDEQYLKQARGILKERQFEADVRFIHASIQGRRGSQWYHRGSLEKIQGPINLLFVDGPVGAIGRAPAVPVFLNRLAPGVRVYLDDYGRAHEKSWFNGWKQFLSKHGRKFTERSIATKRGLGELVIE